MQPDEQAAFGHLLQTPAPQNTPPVTPPAGSPPTAPTPPAAPDPNVAPAWADSLLQTVQGLETRIGQFEQTINTPPPPPAPDPEEDRPRTWAELNKRIEDKAAEKAQQLYDERAQAQANATAAQEDAVKEVEKQLDAQVLQLEQAGVLPQVANKLDKNDAGRMARSELFGYAYAMGTTNLIPVAQTLQKFHERGLRYDPRAGDFVATNSPGGNAPIAGGTPGGATPNNTMPSPDFFRKHSLDEVAEIAERAIQ